MNFRINFFYLDKAEISLSLYRGIKEKKQPYSRRTKATKSMWLAKKNFY